MGRDDLLGTVAVMHPRTPRRRPPARTLVLPALVALVALAVVATSCSSDADSDGAAPASTAASVTTSTTAPVASTAAPTAPPTSAAPVVATFPTPAAAGTALYSAWTKGERAGAGALNLAPPAELDKLFAAAPLAAAKNRGCDDGDFDAASCFFGNGEGGVNVGLVPAEGGWAVATIDPFS